MNWDKDTICRMMVQMLNDGQLSLREEAEIRGVFEERENRRKEKRIAYDLLGLLQREVRHEEGIGKMMPEKQDGVGAPGGFGDTVYWARRQAGMTQNQLAAATGMNQGEISRIERGFSNPSLATIKRLAEGLGMNLNIGLA